MASERFVVTIVRYTELNERGETVYPVDDPDPIQFPNLNARQRDRLMTAAFDSVGFDATYVETELDSGWADDQGR